MDLNLLKELYFKEYKKLEEMWIFKQESKIQFLKLRKEIIDKAKEHLSIGEISGRSDISEEVKEKVIYPNEEKINDRLDSNIDEDLTQIENEEKDEVRAANYQVSEYADYLYQLEKVTAIEGELENNRLFPADVYTEMKWKEEKQRGG